jgi:hypothetical protein
MLRLLLLCGLAVHVGARRSAFVVRDTHTTQILPLLVMEVMNAVLLRDGVGEQLPSAAHRILSFSRFEENILV